MLALTRISLLALWPLLALRDGRILVSKCFDGNCCDLKILKDSLIYQSTGPNPERIVGPYLAEAQHLVPASEPPIRDVRSKDGWRIIVTASLEGYDEIGPQLRLRVFDAALHLRCTLPGDYFLDQIQIGRLFGDTTNILAIETQGPHAYTVTTRLLLLPQNGDPKVILTENAKLIGYRAGHVSLDRQMYDGIHAETKAWKRQSWRWDSRRKHLIVK